MERSALDKLMGVNLSGVSLDSAYKAADLLLKNKEAIEDHLRQIKDRDVLALKPPFDPQNERLKLYGDDKPHPFAGE